MKTLFFKKIFLVYVLMFSSSYLNSMDNADLKFPDKEFYEAVVEDFLFDKLDINLEDRERVDFLRKYLVDRVVKAKELIAESIFREDFRREVVVFDWVNLNFNENVDIFYHPTNDPKAEFIHFPNLREYLRYLGIDPLMNEFRYFPQTIYPIICNIIKSNFKLVFEGEEVSSKDYPEAEFEVIDYDSKGKTLWEKFGKLNYNRLIAGEIYKLAKMIFSYIDN